MFKLFVTVIMHSMLLDLKFAILVVCSLSKSHAELVTTVPKKIFTFSRFILFS